MFETKDLNWCHRGSDMKKGIHPEYHPIVFQDSSTGYAFLAKSTMNSDRSIQWEDGNEYPLVTLEITSSSHPFYTGQQRMVDTAGRVERFRQRYGGAKGASASASEEAPVEDEASSEEE